MDYATEQERFWAGEFGDAYVDRNVAEDWLATKTAFFAKMLAHTAQVNTCLELGSNIGLNLRAIRALHPNIKMQAVEINKKAAAECAKIPNTEVYAGSAFDFPRDKTYDLTFTCGVLIHIEPNRLVDMYDTLYQCSKRYILISEYYNPTPVEVLYRGNEGKLFKRDFAGELMDRYPDLQLLDYGFLYHRDANTPADDMTWFLLEKR